MSTRYKTVLLFGPPGAGKGTQGRILGCIPGFHHVATGDIFRNLDTCSELGRVFHEYSSRGELVPDEITIQVWQQHMEGLEKLKKYSSRCQMLLLDGIPRNCNQARLLDERIEVLRVIHLVCKDQEEMIRRIQRRAQREQRHDDADEKIIRHRLEIYRNETAPVLEFYGSNRICEVDAVGSPGRVVLEVLRLLVPLQEEHFGNALER